MPVLPIPMIIALLLFAFLAYRMLTQETHATLLALIAVCATQSAIMALVQYYGVSAIRPAQPLLATLIPPVAWLAFSQAAGGTVKSRGLPVHLAGFAAAAICLLLRSPLLDVLIPTLFASYGAAMLLRLRRGEDSLPHSRLESGTMPLLAWRIIAVSLIASAASDALIAFYLSRGEDGALLWVPSLVSSLTMLSLGAFSLTNAIESRRDDAGDGPAVSHEDAQRDQSIVANLDGLVLARNSFLDPDLTLARLSRKLLVPAKQLSAAINREFLRVKGASPSKWLETRP